VHRPPEIGQQVAPAFNQVAPAFRPEIRKRHKLSGIVPTERRPRGRSDRNLFLRDRLPPLEPRRKVLRLEHPEIIGPDHDRVLPGPAASVRVDPPQVPNEQQLVVEVVFEPEDDLVLSVQSFEFVFAEERAKHVLFLAVTGRGEILHADAGPLVSRQERRGPVM